MATEKILIFDEAGNAKRMKVRIARFLDNEPVTASDKTNIRTTLDVDDSLSGTFTTPLSVTSASDSSFTGGGSLGIGTASPDRALHCYSSSVATVLKLDSAGADTGLEFAHSDTVAAGINCSTGGDLEFRTGANSGANLRWTINSSGNLVANSTGIDFGSGATLDSYEVGNWTPAYNTTSSGFTNPPTMDVLNARYVRIGDLVTFYCHIQTDSVDLTGAGTYLLVNGLPYAATVSSGGNNVAVNIGYAAAWANAPSGGYVQGGQTYIYLTKRVSSITGNLTEMSPSDLTAGTVANQNSLMISGSYYTTA